MFVFYLCLTMYGLTKLVFLVKILKQKLNTQKEWFLLWRLYTYV